MDLIDSLIFEGWLKTPRIIEAFREIKRVFLRKYGVELRLIFNEPSFRSLRHKIKFVILNRTKQEIQGKLQEIVNKIVKEIQVEKYLKL